MQLKTLQLLMSILIAILDWYKNKPGKYNLKIKIYLNKLLFGEKFWKKKTKDILVGRKKSLNTVMPGEKKKTQSIKIRQNVKCSIH